MHSSLTPGLDGVGGLDGGQVQRRLQLDDLDLLLVDSRAFCFLSFFLSS